MKIGQMTNKEMVLNPKASYLQFDICGLNRNDAIKKIEQYKEKNPYIKEVILHADWEKKGNSENNINTRYLEYIEIIKEVGKEVDILGITIHPVFRRKYDFLDFLKYCDIIGEYTNVFIENRSSSRIYLSKPNEIIEFSQNNIMTIDIPQLYISCKYDKDLFYDTLSKINHNNVREYHISNIKRTERNSFVARRLNDEEGILDYKEIVKYLNKDSFVTFEILWGDKYFKEQYYYFKSIVEY